MLGLGNGMAKNRSRLVLRIIRRPDRNKHLEKHFRLHVASPTRVRQRNSHSLARARG